MKSADVERLLQEEIAEVVGCTEPAAIAYAVQCAKRYLKKPFDPNAIRVILQLSPEVMRNASTAVVPVVKKRGIKAAVVAGLLSSSTDFNLFAGLKIPHKQPLLSRRSWLTIIPSMKHGIYIRAVLTTPKETVALTIKGRHNSVVAVEKNGEMIYRRRQWEPPKLKGFKEIARIAERRDRRLESLARDFVMRQVRRDPEKSLSERIAALITGRMLGQPLPVVTVTGSGNQGIFLGLPLYALYRRMGKRALPVVLYSLLTQVYLSQVRKRISSECGLATKAAPALAAGLAYARGDTPASIAFVIRTLRERLTSMPCRGATPSCGVKGARALRRVFETLTHGSTCCKI